MGSLFGLLQEQTLYFILSMKISTQGCFMVPYTFTHINDRLILISWLRSPSFSQEVDFIRELRQLLDDASTPLYFISDVRNGRMISAQAISQLVNLTNHENWGGSTAFSDNSLSNIFVSQFYRSLGTVKDANSTFQYAEEAIAYLQTIAPDITNDVNWSSYLPQVRS